MNDVMLNEFTETGKMFMGTGIFCLFLAWVAAGTIAEAGADETPIRAWAASCATCHGTQGVSASTIPTLAGRPADELNRLLLEFKRDERKGSIMNQHAKGYTDAELKQLAEYFSMQHP